MNLNDMTGEWIVSLNGTIDERWPTIGGGTIHVVIPPEKRRPWLTGGSDHWLLGCDDFAVVADSRDDPQSHHCHPFGMTWPQDALKGSDCV
jgi:hypothetical protein